MTTTTSFFDKRRFVGLYKSTFRRNIGYFGLLCALLAIFYPLQYAMEAFKYVDQVSPSMPLPTDLFHYFDFGGLGMNFTGVSSVFFTAIVLLAPMVLALLLGSYMQSKKAADVYHALPVRRELLLLVNSAVAMSFIAIPVVLSTVAVALMQIIRFGFLPAVLGWLFLDMLGWLIAAFCIYTITAFVSVLVGTVFDNFVLAGSLLIAPPAIYGLFILVAQIHLYGFFAGERLMSALLNLSPLTMMPARFMFEYTTASGSISNVFGDGLRGMFAASNITLAVWLVLGILLFCLTARLYRARHSEIAETTTSKGLLQVLIKLVGVIITAVCTGLLFQAFGAPNALTTFYLWAAIGGALGYVIIEVILNRGFKTLARSLPLGALMLAVALGGCATLTTGGLGYENRLPAVSNITSVSINYDGRFASRIVSLGEPLTEVDATGVVGNVNEKGRNEGAFKEISTLRDLTLREEQNIATVLAFHAATVAEKYERNRSTLFDAGKESAYPNINITYTLRGGGSMSRYYNGTTTDTLQLLAPLETASECVKQTNGAFYTDPRLVTEWRITDAFGVNNITHAYSTEDSRLLLEAIKLDLLTITQEELLNTTKLPIAVISYIADYPPEGNQLAARGGDFHVTSETQETYRFLQQKGLLAQLTVDTADIYAAVVGFGNHQTGHAIRLSPNGDEFTADELATIKKDIASRKEYLAANPPENDRYSDDYRMDYKTSGQEIFEDAADIKALLDATVSSAGVTARVASVNFYFKGAPRGTTVYVAVDRLPDDLKKRVSAFNGAGLNPDA